MNGSTSYPNKIVSDFLENPIGFRVELPDGSMARVCQFVDDDEPRLHRVVGLDSKSQFCKLPPGIPHWYTADDLVIRYFTVSINPDWRPSVD